MQPLAGCSCTQAMVICLHHQTLAIRIGHRVTGYRVTGYRGLGPSKERQGVLMVSGHCASVLRTLFVFWEMPACTRINAIACKPCERTILTTAGEAESNHVASSGASEESCCQSVREVVLALPRYTLNLFCQPTSYAVCSVSQSRVI